MSTLVICDDIYKNKSNATPGGRANGCKSTGASAGYEVECERLQARSFYRMCFTPTKIEYEAIYWLSI